MCVLVIGVGWHDALPLVVAANRDEEYARPAGNPEVEPHPDRTVLRPLDLRARGTWEGINSLGLLTIITNRRDGSFRPERRSRGLLCREALKLADTLAVESFLDRALRDDSYNSFNLLHADRRRVCLSSWNGSLETQVLGAGTHVLSNEHGLGELTLTELENDWPPEPGAVRTRLVEILASHDPRDAHGFRVCKHGERYGTVSSSFLFQDGAGRTWMEHAAGPPCTAAFQRYDLP